MFSSAQNGNTTAPRESRRRRRGNSSDLTMEPKKKKQRSVLTEATFLPPNGGVPEMAEANSKIATIDMTSDGLVVGRELAVRGGKKPRSGDRGQKGDGSTILAANDIYTVSKLPALPDRLRTEHERRSRQHGAIYPESGYALTLTHTHATVWPYADHNSSPETFTFAISQPSKHTSDPLPLGSLVSASASSPEPGLVVVIPTTGRITYWESISSAATMDLRLQRNGVEFSIPGMYSGESVVQILNAEPAGFVLGLSTGRSAYMSVRDGHGRPAISVQFLRSNSGLSNGGLFGSIRNVLSSTAWKGDIVAIRAGYSKNIGERTVVAATAKGRLQCWNMHRGGHTSLDAEADCREDIVMAVKNATPALNDLLLESFEMLDFTFTPRPLGNSQVIQREDAGERLLLLASLTDRYRSHYYLVDGILRKAGEFEISKLRAIKSYSTPVSRIAISKPRLHLPNPGLVAFVVFDRAVVVLSMARQPDSPDSQLLSENHLLPQAFEDVIDFREDLNVEVVGSGLEEPHGKSHGAEDSKSKRYKARYPAAVLLVRGGGVVRIAATDVSKLTTSGAQQLTAKSKLEQAVFFGNLRSNPINFAVRPELQFSPEEVGQAALELSDAILRSEVSYIPSVPASIEQNLQKRSEALRDLISYLKDSGVALGRVTKWKLLWDAEKMMAASLIWTRYDATMRDKPVGEKRGLLTEVVESIHEDYKSNPVAEAGELDRVRHWFIKDISNIQLAIPWAYQVIKYTYQDGEKDHDTVLRILSEADDLVLNALLGAYEFRTKNLEVYGLTGEVLEHGVLVGNYDELPEFWTSTTFVTQNLRKQAELAGALVQTYWGKPIESSVDMQILTKVRNEYSKLLDVAIRSNTERIRWDSSQESPDLRSEAAAMKDDLAKAEERQIALLAGIFGLPDDAIELAEKHEILDTLAYVLKYEMSAGEHLREGYRNPDARARELRQRVQSLFDKFGTRWANAMFQFEIDNGSLQTLMEDWPEQQDYLTDFLRSRPQYAKIAWINDILSEKDFNQASETLLELGLRREQDAWSKKIELSMGKLALLAAQNGQSDGAIIKDTQQNDLDAVKNVLGLIKIQDQAYDFVLPSIDNAIDENAELQLALEAQGNKGLKNQQAFQTLLADSMTKLIKRKTLDAPTLVDLLTLMGSNGPNGQHEVLRSQQFRLALQAIGFGLSRHDHVLIQRIIWRRCFLRDDWADVNNTASKDDQEVSEQLAGTVLYQTFLACLKAGMFEKDSYITPISPRDVLGAGTETLELRFTGLDEHIRDTIIRDMQAEDDALLPLIEQNRLDKWHHSVLELAKADFAKEVDEETDGGKLMQEAEEMLEETEKRIKSNETGRAETLLHSKPRYKPKAKLNGGLRASIKQR